tara:strand:+ start:84 stop:704 length:621 start_codon:yes stop_codon:yes gene_type:complete
MLKKYVNVEVSMIVSENGDVYIGQQVNEQKQGLGSMYYVNGNVYTGNWFNDIREGCGVFIENTGTQFVGKWHNNKLHWHKNQIQFANGNFYEGCIKNGEISGEGKMIYKTNEAVAYTGEWLNGEWHGKGTITYTDGETYTGEFYENERRGQGKCVWPSGIEYEGGWECDNIHGEGMLDARKLDNRIHFGPWSEGIQLQAGYTMTII